MRLPPAQRPKRREVTKQKGGECEFAKEWKEEEGRRRRSRGGGVAVWQRDDGAAVPGGEIRFLFWPICLRVLFSVITRRFFNVPHPPILPPPKILLQEQAAMTEEEDKKDNEDVDEDDNYRSNLTRLR